MWAANRQHLAYADNCNEFVWVVVICLRKVFAYAKIIDLISVGAILMQIMATKGVIVYASPVVSRDRDKYFCNVI